MTDNQQYNHFVIFALILIVGLGLALALPWLANSHSMAAHHDAGTPTDLLVPLYSGKLVGIPVVKNYNQAPMAPITCFAAISDGGGEFESPDASAVQLAVDAASPGDVVKLAGDCMGVMARGGLLQTVYISKSLTLEGGHTQSDWSLAPDPDTYTTTLDANQGGRVAVISGTIEVTLDSLFLTRGHADDGGGIWSNSAMTLKNSIVYSNTAANGGGILNYTNSNPVLDNVTFIDNESEYGGGMYNFYISPTIMTNLKFLDNKSKNGGGMFNVGSNPTMTNITFSGNLATQRGGGLTNSNSSPVIINSRFSGNMAEEYGGGLYDSSCRSTLINVTFSGNLATLLGGGMVNSASFTDVSNGIFWNNQDSTGNGTYTATILNDGSTVTLTHSLVESSGAPGSWALDPTSYVNGGGNLDTDPLFILPATCVCKRARQPSMPGIIVLSPSLQAWMATNESSAVLLIWAPMRLWGYHAKFLCR